MEYLIKIAFSLLPFFTVCGYDRPFYFIRDARIDDRCAIIDLCKLSSDYYNASLIHHNKAAAHKIDSMLHDAVYQGFAFVIESISSEHSGQIIAFLCKHRSAEYQYSHILDHGMFVVHPNFRKEMLITQLYRHLQRQVEDFYPDILKIESLCPECFDENIAMYLRCDFEIEGRRKWSFRNRKNEFFDELVFAWWNKNFDKKQTPSS